MFVCGVGVRVSIWVGRPCPPVRNDTATPRHLYKNARTHLSDILFLSFQNYYLSTILRVVEESTDQVGCALCDSRFPKMFVLHHVYRHHLKVKPFWCKGMNKFHCYRQTSDIVVEPAMENLLQFKFLAMFLQSAYSKYSQ